MTTGRFAKAAIGAARERTQVPIRLVDRTRTRVFADPTPHWRPLCRDRTALDELDTAFFEALRARFARNGSIPNSGTCTVARKFASFAVFCYDRANSRECFTS